MTITAPIHLEVGGRTLDAEERLLAYCVLLAQVDDVHAPVWSWTPEQTQKARRLLDALASDTSVTGRTLSTCLMVPIHDLDHPVPGLR